MGQFDGQVEGEQYVGRRWRWRGIRDLRRESIGVVAAAVVRHARVSAVQRRHAADSPGPARRQREASEQVGCSMLERGAWVWPAIQKGRRCEWEAERRGAK